MGNEAEGPAGTKRIYVADTHLHRVVVLQVARLGREDILWRCLGN